MRHSHGHTAAFAALAVLALVWGYNWVVMKVALSYAPPFPFGALRAAGAAGLLFAMLIALRKPLRPPAPARMVWLALFQTFGFVALSTFALHSGHAGKTAILVYTMPFWVLVLAVPILGERVTPGKAVAGGLGFAGLLLILSPWAAHPTFLSTLLAAGAGLDWAIAVLIAKKIPAHGTWELLALNAWQALIGCIPLGLAAILVPAPPVHWSLPFDLALAYNIVLGTSLAWFLWLFVLSRLPAGLSGLSALVIPVVGIAAAWAQLGERPGGWEAAGVLAVIAGLGLLTWTEGRSVRRSRSGRSPS